MDFKAFVFYFLAAILIFAALRVITSRNPVHAALFLVLTFFTASGILVLLEAEFLALVLILIYVGAVMVLFLFVVMMLDINIDRVRQGFWSYLPLGLIVALVLVLEIGLVIGGSYQGWFESQPSAMPADAAALDVVGAAPGGAASTATADPSLKDTTVTRVSNVRSLAVLLYTKYYYPFELASIILLIAIIAAVVIAYRGPRPNKRIDPMKQVFVKAKDRLKVISMPAEKQD